MFQGAAVAGPDGLEERIVQGPMIPKRCADVAQIGPGDDQCVIAVLLYQVAEGLRKHTQINTFPIARRGPRRAAGVRAKKRNDLERVGAKHMLKPCDLQLNRMLPSVVEFEDSQVAAARLQAFDELRIGLRRSQ